MPKMKQTPNPIAVSVVALGVFAMAFTFVAAKTPVVTKLTTAQVLGDETGQSEADKHAAEQANEQQKQQNEQQQHNQEQQQEQNKSGNQGGNSGNNGNNSGGNAAAVATSAGPATSANAPIKPSVKPSVKPAVHVQTEDDKEETEFEQDDVHIKTKIEDDGTTKIEMASPSGEGSVTFSRDGVHAETHFPVTINRSTKQVTVTTPNGEKDVTVQPDEAVHNALSHDVLSTVPNAPAATPGASPAPQIQLEMRDGSLVYRVDGAKQLRVLGFIPITMPTTAFVSSENGQVVSQEQSLLTKLLGFISR